MSLSACQSGGNDATHLTSQVGDPAPREAAGVEFDGARALADWTRLAEIGERTTDSRAAGRARAHLRRQLRRAGFDADDVETVISTRGDDGEPIERKATHVLGFREGAVEDVILLVAPYDSPPSSRSPDATSGSAAALLLEVARLDDRVREEIGDPPFGLALAFVDGDALGSLDPTASEGEAHPGSDAFARWWLEREAAPPVRLVIWLDRVGARDVEIARDLDSSRAYREIFFDIGIERGLEPAFAAARPLSSPDTGHRAFIARGFSPVVALVGSATVTDTTIDPGYEEQGQAVAGPEGLDAVGEATWWGLVSIIDRLARIDAFRTDPLGAGPGALSLPGSEDAPDAATSEGEGGEAGRPPQ